MSDYICHHCGATVKLSIPIDRYRACPNCGRHLRVCENCQFYDVSGCVIGGTERFTVSHGTLCNKFQFRTQSVTPA